MDMDLNARSAKWKREQEKLKERARRQAQTEALKRAAAAKAQAAMEEIQVQKRQERIEEQERQEQLALEEQRLTGGIKYQQTLTPFPTSGDGDKITLPVSALETLNPQGAFDLGAFTFELSFRSPQHGSTSTQNVLRKTHAGVLEFVADEGTVGLPPKVALSLFGGGSDFVPAQIQVKYVRLEKGTSASLQPCGEGFGDRALDWKPLLERALRAHTTLSTGDVVLVRYVRETFSLRVAALAPADAVNVLNTDLEVALLPSEAVEAALQRAAAQKRAEERAQQAADARTRRAHEREQLRAQRCATLVQQLAPEPPVDDAFQTKIVLRLPNGTQATRRVAHAAALQHVLALVEASTGDAAETFQLVATYPRRVFGVNARDKTLQELGLNGRQEALFVEKINAQPHEEEEDDMEPVDVEMETMREPVVATPLPAAWQEAQRALEQQLDEALNAHETTPIHALEPVMPVHDAGADQSTKWQAQLAELAAMGFTNDALNIQVLERYQGRLLRVVNYLSELASSSSAVDEPPLIEPMQE